jgi:hypothetical protein
MKSICFVLSITAFRRPKIDQGDGGKDEMRKVENWKSKSQIKQGIFNHEGRKMTRKGGGKDEMRKVEN